MQHRQLCRLNAFSGTGFKQPSCYGPPDLCALERLIVVNRGTSRGQSLATCRRSAPGLLKAYQCVFRVAAAYWLLERSEQVDCALSNLTFFRGAVPRAHFSPLIDCPLGEDGDQ